MGIHDKGDLKIKVECTKEQFAYLKSFLIPKQGTEHPCVFRNWEQVPNCYGCNCHECFAAYFERVLPPEEQAAQYEAQRKRDGKPPLGVPTEYVWKEQRKTAINEAIQRYLAEGLEIPAAWVDEYNRLCKDGGSAK